MITRAVEIYREEGMKSLARSSKDFVVYRLPDIETVYWNVKGEQTLSVGETTAKFGSSTGAGGHKVRKSYRTEKEFLRDVVRDLGGRDVFYDVGANLGLFSCFAAKKLSGGNVVAFEPYPPNAEQLRENINRNGVSGNCTVVEAAVLDKTGTTDFGTTRGDGVGTQTANTRPERGLMKVDCFRGDRLINDEELPQPNVVKIDVEGAEPLVIEGMKDTLSEESCRSVYCEVHLPWEGGDRPSVRDYGETAETLKMKLERLGFSIEYKKKRGRELQIRACKN